MRYHGRNDEHAIVDTYGCLPLVALEVWCGFAEALARSLSVRFADGDFVARRYLFTTEGARTHDWRLV
jgi:hypothetical protein